MSYEHEVNTQCHWTRRLMFYQVLQSKHLITQEAIDLGHLETDKSEQLTDTLLNEFGSSRRLSILLVSEYPIVSQISMKDLGINENCAIRNVAPMCISFLKSKNIFEFRENYFSAFSCGRIVAGTQIQGSIMPSRRYARAWPGFIVNERGISSRLWV